MTKRLRWPLAQICQRARAKPSQPRKAMTPGTSGRLSFDPSAGVRCRRDLSSSDVEVSCNREPPRWLSQREGQILGQAGAAYQSDALRCDWPQMNMIRQAGARHDPPRLAQNDTETEGRGGCRAEKRDAGEVLRAVFRRSWRISPARIRAGRTG